MLEIEREKAVEKAELMRKKAAMGATPLFAWKYYLGIIAFDLKCIILFSLLNSIVFGYQEKQEMTFQFNYNYNESGFCNRNSQSINLQALIHKKY